MRRIIASCSIIAVAVMAAACSGRETTTTIRRETVQTAPGDPAVVEKTEKTTTIHSGAVERRTTETRETDD